VIKPSHPSSTFSLNALLHGKSGTRPLPGFVSQLCAYYHHHLLVGLVAGGQAEHSHANAKGPHLGIPSGAMDGMEAAQLLRF
jgi:hypothetical protein